MGTVITSGRTQPMEASPAADAPALGFTSTQALDTMSREAALELAAENAGDQEALARTIGVASGPMGVLTSPRTGLPTFIGGPGFGIGQFDLSADPVEIVEAVLARWNFLELAQPRDELELVRDRQHELTRVLTFRQRLRGLPLLESRLVFEFDGWGRFVHFGGEYHPPALEALADEAPSCEAMLGSVDELGNEVVRCAVAYSRANRFTGRPEARL